MRHWLYVAALLSFPAAALAVAPGDVAPDFALLDTSGASISLSGFAGKVVLLAFVGYG